MEERSPPSEPTGASERATKLAQRWAQMLRLIMTVWEANRMNFVLLARAELGTKASRVEAMKQLCHVGHAVAKCLHPAQRLIHRSNQYASWTVCAICSARISYRSKRAMGKGRGRGARVSALTPELPAPAYGPMTAEPNLETATSHRVPTSRPSGSQEMEILQQALHSFNLQSSQFGQLMVQVQQSLQELAHGQGQMLTLMQPQSPSAMMEDDRWSAVDMQNPNENMQNPNENDHAFEEVATLDARVRSSCLFCAADLGSMFGTFSTEAA